MLGAGIEADWITGQRPVVMKNVPTAVGLVSFTIRRDEGGLLVEVKGGIPDGVVEVRLGRVSKTLNKLPGWVLVDK